MESPTMDRHLSNAEEAQLAEALELRWKQIDREIAEFKVEKEKEFRKFEKRLRSEKRDAERQKILQCEREVDKANSKRKGSKSRTNSSTKGSQPQRYMHGVDSSEAVLEDNRSNGVRFAGATEIPQESDASQTSHRTKNDKSKDQRTSHERELEFQGLFTPTYLPLLSGHRKGDTKPAPNDMVTDKPVKDETAKKPDDTSAHRDEKNGNAQVRPSTSSQSGTVAPISGSAPVTPAYARLSLSDPRKASMSERRSSSRSDTSVSSLRSSLRDPKQPRSPKRVLFSIDNVVVSPSTSPAIQREINASKRVERIDVVSKLDASDMSISQVEEKPDPYAWQRDVAGKSSKSALTNIPTTNGNIGKSGSQPPVHPASQIGRGGTSPSMGGDGFEHIRSGEEDDDLFAFDEDIRYMDKGTRDEDEGVGDAEEDMQDDDDNVKNGDEELPTSSPHAGSLPIEIRWPGRKDPRG